MSAAGAARERDRFFVLASLVVVLGVGAVALAGVLAQVTAQYVFVFGPFIALVAVWPLDRIAERFGGSLAAAGYTALLALPLASESVLYFLVRHGERPRWREAYSYVANNRGAEDVIIGMQASVGEYYLAPGTTDLRNPTVVAWNDRHNEDTYAVWALRDRPMWLVMRPDFFGKWPREDRRNLEAFLREECRLARRFPVEMEGRDLDVEVWFRP